MVPTDLKYTTVASMVQVRALSGTGVSALGDLFVFFCRTWKPGGIFQKTWSTISDTDYDVFVARIAWL